MKLLFPLFLSLLSPAFASTSSYLIENLSFPDDMPPEIGGLAASTEKEIFMPAYKEGDIVVTQPGKDSAATLEGFRHRPAQPHGHAMGGPWTLGGKPNGRAYGNYRYRRRRDGRPLQQPLHRIWNQWQLPRDQRNLPRRGRRILRCLGHCIAQWSHLFLTPW